MAAALDPAAALPDRSRPFVSDAWHRVADVRCSLRAGIDVVPLCYRGRLWYVLREPASARVHRLSGKAWAWLSRLDGSRSVDEAWRAHVDADPDHAPGQSEVVELLGDLFGADLLESDRATELAVLVERRKRLRKPLWLQNLSNPLALRLPLWNPDRFLTRVHALLRPVIGAPAWWLWLAVVVPGAVLAAMNAGELTNNLADRLLSPDQLLLLLPLLFAIKLVHELAHGVMVKSGGGRCYEIGLMLLVLAPVPYVDAGAANAMPSKWRRAAIGAAGMWIELLLCALATFAWLLLEPGFTRGAAHHVILVTGIATLLFNANPLLRFDGYYILCDLIEIPNLGSRSNALWLALLRRHLLGDRDHALPAVERDERGWLLGYAPLALAYRLALTLAIALFLVEAYPLLGAALALLALVTTLVWPLLKGAAFVLAEPSLGRHRPRALRRLGLTLAVAAALLFAAPLPLTVVVEGVLWVPPEAELRAGEQGTVADVLVADGKSVAAATPLLRLHNADLDAEWRSQQARVQELQVRHEAERAPQGGDRLRAALTNEELLREQAALAVLQQRVDALAIASRIEGRLQWSRATDLPGHPFERGDLIGVIDTAEQPRVRSVVGQDDIGLVRDRVHEVQVLLVDAPGAPIAAQIARELPGGESRLPSRALAQAGGGPWAIDPADESGLRTLQRVFEVDVALATRPPGARIGTRALVKFRMQDEPLGQQAWRRLRQLFLARLDL